MKRPPLRYTVPVGMLLAIFLAWLCWPSSRLTFENVARVHAGQTYPEVVAILGKPDNGPTFFTSHEYLLWEGGEGMAQYQAEWGRGHGTPLVVVRFRIGLVSKIDTWNIKP